MASKHNVGRNMVLLNSLDSGPNITSEPIKIIVGESQQMLFVSKQLLESSSLYFKNALKKEWSEGEERIVELPNTEVEILTIYLKWLCTGRLFCVPLSSMDDDLLWEYLDKCYAMADYLQDSDFKDAIIDSWTEALIETNRCSYRIGQSIYPYSCKDSAHRRFTQDVVINVFGRLDTFPGFFQASDTPLEFLQDVVVALHPNPPDGVRSTSIKKLFAKKSPCHYHDHGSDRPCYRTRFNL